MGYREWIYVGTPVTPNDLNDGAAAFPEFHNVYVDPDSWALFTADDPATNAASDFRSDCLGCHVPARETDWVYVEAYPTLEKR